MTAAILPVAGEMEERVEKRGLVEADGVAELGRLEEVLGL